MMDRLLELAGLTGRRERYTRGEFYWAVGMASAAAFCLGIVLVLVTGGVKC